MVFQFAEYAGVEPSAVAAVSTVSCCARMLASLSSKLTRREPARDSNEAALQLDSIDSHPQSPAGCACSIQLICREAGALEISDTRLY